MIEGIFAWIALIYGILNDQPLFIVACAIFALAAQVAKCVEYQRKFKDKKCSDELENSKFPKVTINRIGMIDQAKVTNDKTDFDKCQFYKNYMKQQFGNETLNPMIEDTKLSNRNVGCMRNVFKAIKKGNIDDFWMELSDFIENYYSTESVTYVEYQVFTVLFDFGIRNLFYEEKEIKDE